MLTKVNNPVVLLAACLTAVLLPTSITGTAVILPSIATDIGGGDIVKLQWIVHAYDLTFASFMLAFGSLSDIYGRRRIFQFGMVTYGLCALIASLAHTLLVLDLVRGLTGVAAAALMTSASAALAQNFTGQAQARAFGLFGTSFGAGLAFGPMLGGGLVTAFGWRSFFLAQVLLAVCALLCSQQLPGRPEGSAARIDLPGAGLFVTGLFAFILGLVEASQLGLTHPFVLGCLAVALVLGAAFALVEARSSHPMFDLSLLRQRRYFAVCLSPVTLAFGFVALLVYLPTYFQSAHGLSAWNAGLFMMVLTLPTLFMPAVAGALVARGVSARWLMVLCMSLVAVGVLGLISVRHDTSLLLTALPLIVIGTGFGISNGILDAAAATSVQPHRAGMAVGMFNTMRIAGEVVAIAVAGTLVVSYLRSSLGQNPPVGAQDVGSAKEIANSVAEGDYHGLLSQVALQDRAGFASGVLDALDSAMHGTYLWIGLLCLLTVPVIAAFLRPQPEETPAATLLSPDSADPVHS
jgi:MFS family permease